MSRQPIGIEIKQYYFEVMKQKKLDTYNTDNSNEYVDSIYKLSNKKYKKNVIKRYLEYLYHRGLLN